MSNEVSLVKWDGNGQVIAGPFSLQRTGLVVQREPTYEEWSEIGRILTHVDGSVHWWIGDWLNYGERAYGEKYTQALEVTEFDYDTLKGDRWVAQQIELVRRRTNLPFSHHKEVAALPPHEQDELLSEAEPLPGETEPRLSRSELRAKVKERRLLVAREEAGSFPQGIYSVLYADPPWEYSDQRTGGSSSGAASALYPTMPTDAICALADADGQHILDRASPTAALFLWATAPCLPDALRVVQAWGFDYKAQFVWDKVRGFNGHYNDVRHELLLIALRGSFQPRCESLRGSIVTFEKTRHSRKPDVFYEIIEEMYPVSDPPTHLEIFARKKGTSRPGWALWGNEA